MIVTSFSQLLDTEDINKIIWFSSQIASVYTNKALKSCSCMTDKYLGCVFWEKRALLKTGLLLGLFTEVFYVIKVIRCKR